MLKKRKGSSNKRKKKAPFFVFTVWLFSYWRLLTKSISIIFWRFKSQNTHHSAISDTFFSWKSDHQFWRESGWGLWELVVCCVILLNGFFLRPQRGVHSRRVIDEAYPLHTIAKRSQLCNNNNHKNQFKYFLVAMSMQKKKRKLLSVFFFFSRPFHLLYT